MSITRCNFELGLLLVLRMGEPSYRYRLRAPDNPNPPSRILTPKTGTPTPITRGCGLNIIRYKRISSTNTKAKTLAEKQAAESTVVVSDVQTHGRGRSGRTWKSPKGGLWFSLIIRPKIPVDRISLLQFLIISEDRKSTRLNSSHVRISYAVFCLKKKRYKEARFLRLHSF